MTKKERDRESDSEREIVSDPGVSHISEVVMALEEVQIMSLAVARRSLPWHAPGSLPVQGTSMASSSPH